MSESLVRICFGLQKVPVHEIKSMTNYELSKECWFISFNAKHTRRFSVLSLLSTLLFLVGAAIIYFAQDTFEHVYFKFMLLFLGVSATVLLISYRYYCYYKEKGAVVNLISRSRGVAIPTNPPQ